MQLHVADGRDAVEPAVGRLAHKLGIAGGVAGNLGREFGALGFLLRGEDATVDGVGVGRGGRSLRVEPEEQASLAHGGQQAVGVGGVGDGEADLLEL